MGLFDNKKKSISRMEMRATLKKTSMTRLGTGGKKYTWKQRVSLEKELFPRKYGKEISKKEFGTVMEKMRRTKFGKSPGERLKIQRKINEIKKFAGK